MYTITDQTFIVVPRFAGQTLTLASPGDITVEVTATANEQPVSVYGSGEVTLGPGWWDCVAIFDGMDRYPYFDGSTPSSVDTAFLAVERSTDGGETWQIIADSLDSGTGMADHYPPLYGPLHYRAVAVSSLPSIAYSQPVEVIPPEPTRVWITAENGQAISLPYNLVIPSSHKPAAELHRFLGRDKPVVSFALNHQPDRSVTVSGVTVEEEPGEAAWVDMLVGQPVFYRDPAGRRFWGVVTSSIDWGPRWYGHHSVSFTITEIDHA